MFTTSLLIVSAIAIRADASLCQWTDPVSGESFDLTPMSKKDSGQGWVLKSQKDEKQIFYTNVVRLSPPIDRLLSRRKNARSRS